MSAPRTTSMADLRTELRSVLSDPALRAEAQSCRGNGLPWAPKTYRELGRRRLLAPEWPTELGGGDGSVADGAVVAEELALHGVPDTARVNGVDNLGNTVLAVGSEQQRRRWLPAIASGDVFGTVLYSEYQAGSDLSAVQTSARRDGDGWRLRGTKVWNVRSDLAAVGVVAARTGSQGGPTAERGFGEITLFLVELDAPGIRIQPVESLNVEGFTEVSFDDVAIGPDGVLGGVGHGWAAISRALGAERTGACFAGRARRWLDELRSRVGRAGPDPGDGSALERIAALEVQVEAARALNTVTVGDLAAGRATDSDLAACKWMSSEVARRVAVAAWEDEGFRTLPAGADVPPAWLALREAPGLTLAAGTSEMMLRTVATALLDEADTGVEAADEVIPAVTGATEWRRDLYQQFAQEASRAAAAENPDRALSATLGARNWTHLTVDADAGGLGLDQIDGIALAKALGRAGAPHGPLDDLRIAELAAPVAGAGEPPATQPGATLRQAAYTLGVGRRVLALAARAVQRRHQFGASLATRQGVMFPLAAAAVHCRALEERVAVLGRALDRGQTVTGDAARLLGAAASMAVETCRHSMQAHGASGLTPQPGVESCYRHALHAGARFGPPAALLRKRDNGTRAWRNEDDETGGVAAPEPPDLLRRRVPSSWNNTDVDLPQEVTVAGLVAQAAERHSEAVAVDGPEGTVTYRELHEHACAWAARLRELGAGPGEVIGISLERGRDMVVAVLAVLEAGAAYLPLDPHLPPERIEYLVADSATTLVLTHKWISEWLPPGPRLLCMDCEAPEPAEGWPRRAQPDGLAYLMYTSGSTGRPKGVEVEHRSVVNRMLWDHRRFGLGPGDAVLMHTSLGFDISVWEIFGALTTGARLVLLAAGEENDPAQINRVLRDEQITVLALVPSLLDLLLDDEPGLSAATALRYVFSGGEALSPALCQRVFAATSAELHNFYGPTEVTIDATAWHCTPGNLDGAVPIGRPLDNVRTYVLEDGEPVPVGSPGELHVAGAGLARGYRGRPDLTAQRFVPDTISGRPGRLYRTGDVVRQRCDGALEFLGRLDDQVKIRGFRIEPGEIEHALEERPEVRHAVVCVAHRDGRPDRLEAFVVPHEPIDAGNLRCALADRLPAHMVPAGIHPVSELPLAPTGKVDHAALLDQLPNTGSATQDQPSDDLTSFERQVADLVTGVLGIEAIGPDEDFFDRGGDSLNAARVVSRMRRTLDREVDLNLFLQRPTVRGLVRAAAGKEDDG